MVDFRTAFERRRVKAPIKGKSLTKQSFAESCDINHILAKYEKTGVLEYARDNQGSYADVSQMGDFREACEVVLQARELFDAMPAKLRKRFNNDPGDFLDFMDDPSNKDEIVALGLAELRQASNSVSATMQDVSQDEDVGASGENSKQEKL